CPRARWLPPPRCANPFAGGPGPPPLREPRDDRPPPESEWDSRRRSCVDLALFAEKLFGKPRSAAGTDKRRVSTRSRNAQLYLGAGPQFAAGARTGAPQRQLAADTLGSFAHAV